MQEPPGFDFPRPRHGRRDYRRLSRSCQTTSHYEYTPWRRIWEVSPGGKRGHHSAEYWLGSGEENVDLYCVLFDPNGPTPGEVNPLAHPVVRAGTLVHEGQHSWEVRYQDEESYGHQPCPWDLNMKCDVNHEHSRYDIGHAYLYDHTHNPYQVQREFYCDLAERPRAWVPADLRAMAYIESIERANHLDPRPGDHCGNPFPLGRSAPGRHCSSTACQCESGLDFCPGVGCVDLLSDRDNCGKCGEDCADRCVNGACASCTFTEVCDSHDDCPLTGICLAGCCAPVPE